MPKVKFIFACAILSVSFITNAAAPEILFIRSMDSVGLYDLSKGQITVSKGDAFAIKSNELIFGWIANPATDVAGKTVHINGVNDGKYRLRLYHTWRGQYLDTTEVSAANGSMSFTIPVLHMNDHGNYIGQDVAFVIDLLPLPVMPADNKTKLPRKKNSK